MQGAIARVCMVVAAAILNHPLLFPQENTTLPEQDEELIARMREHEERLEMEQAKLEKELSQLDSKQEETRSEEGYGWYFWSALSFVIFFTIEMCRADSADTEIRPVDEEDVFSESESVSPSTMVLDKDILSNFCDRSTYTSAHENWRIREFVEGFADDLLESLIVDRTPDELLCSKNTPYLAKDQVMKWFQIFVTKAWGRISHKYDFEVTFRNLDAAGALKIRFRSGKVIVMNIIPVVQLEDTDAYFVSHFPSDCDSSPDPYWPLSFAVYERNLLKHFTKRLPQNSCHLHCLQIVSFLHRKQTGLTGKSALTNYHFKTALLHLLLSKRPSLWGIDNVEHRLRDVLNFIQRSLQEKRLHHILIGNRKVPDVLQVPEIVCKAMPINLFRSLVLQRELYAATARHFQEMLRNSTVLLQEYTSLLSNGGVHHSLDESV
ncbi:inositol 1,4,5-trisphosphate receptor-interacting protein-like [Scomber japonicus]|uniref:inositol 1,4,5-trisphosphate receptor-interacting protein-like n=1 Tax=Scomber japonicus TaxID=13676 RepID=UPI0023059955|nr:inositol 1,4,5-trisphosphate receptor-interacting protein-like [Scomber japonicus]